MKCDGAFRRSHLVAVVAVIVAVLLLSSCSSQFGMRTRPNPWAMACEQSAVFLAGGTSQRRAAAKELGSIVERYGDSEGKALRVLVGRVARGAKAGQDKPVRRFYRANCGTEAG